MMVNWWMLLESMNGLETWIHWVLKDDDNIWINCYLLVLLYFFSIPCFIYVNLKYIIVFKIICLFFSYQKLYWRGVRRWIICFIIGVLTGLTASVIDLSVENISHVKFTTIKSCILTRQFYHLHCHYCVCNT